MSIDLREYQTGEPDEPYTAQTILIGEGVKGDSLISAALSGARHFVQKDGNEFESELAFAKRGAENPNAFIREPLKQILGKEPNPQQLFSFSATANTSKRELIPLLETFFATHRHIFRMKDDALLVADELFTNGAKNSKMAHAGSIEFLVYADVSRVIMLCIDNFGLLEPADLLARIHQCFALGVSKAMRPGGDGAGIGTYMIFSSCSSLYLGIHKFHRTVVGCSLQAAATLDRQGLSKNLHILDSAASAHPGAEMSQNDKTVILGSGGQATAANETLVALSGSIDEDFEFPEIANPLQTIRLDLDGVKSVNSIGIRSWMIWSREIAKKAKLNIERAQKAMVFQMNMVDGFVPAGSWVSSFYVPFYCPSCENNQSVLYNVGKDVYVANGGYKLILDPVEHAPKCLSCGQPTEFDAIPEKYFHFLKALTK